MPAPFFDSLKTKRVLPLAVLCSSFIFAAAGAQADDRRGTRIAMAVALLDVAEDHCRGRFTVSEAERRRLMADFHDYDIAGLASLLSRPLNAFYEDFAHEAKQGRDLFCRKAPARAAATGYSVIAGGG